MHISVLSGALLLAATAHGAPVLPDSLPTNHTSYANLAPREDEPSKMYHDFEKYAHIVTFQAFMPPQLANAVVLKQEPVCNMLAWGWEWDVGKKQEIIANGGTYSSPFMDPSQAQGLRCTRPPGIGANLKFWVQDASQWQKGPDRLTFEERSIGPCPKGQRQGLKGWLNAQCYGPVWTVFWLDELATDNGLCKSYTKRGWAFWNIYNKPVLNSFHVGCIDLKDLAEQKTPVTGCGVRGFDVCKPHPPR